jgi:hypothetical protein
MLKLYSDEAREQAQQVLKELQPEIKVRVVQSGRQSVWGRARVTQIGVEVSWIIAAFQAGFWAGFWAECAGP